MPYGGDQESVTWLIQGIKAPEGFASKRADPPLYPATPQN